MSAFPTGLSRNWQSKNSAGKKSANRRKKDIESLSPASSLDGGLADEDAIGEAPPVDLRKGRNSKRANDVRVDVLISFIQTDPRQYQLIGMSTDEEVNSVPRKSRPVSAGDSHLAARSSKAKANTLVSKRAKRELSSGDEVTTIAYGRLQMLTHCKVKRASSDDVTAAPSNNEVPRFARPGWVTRFLPTLCHRLASAKDPWNIGAGTDTLVVIQGVFEKAYPDSGYNVTFKSKVYLMVRCIDVLTNLLMPHAY